MPEKVRKGPAGTPFLRRYKVTGGNISRGYGVKRGSNDDEVVIADANADGLGILAETTNQDNMGDVCEHGECVAIAGAAITQGQWLKFDASGKVVPSAGEDQPNIGRAKSSATADGDEVLVFVLQSKKRS
jgi:hypothetical protein